ncbi:ribosome biogenesis protein bop1-like [Tubulanus polymorphus]|uniref:ribosome biogenesis protein bop1-like n=1 Tax=Tubulanus polymorphus TaxID=672921 RepID=UPI003DA45924
MAASMKRKHDVENNRQLLSKAGDLFLNAANDDEDDEDYDASDDESDNDTTDSEDSVYSDLEEEEDDSDDEQSVDSFDEVNDSDVEDFDMKKLTITSTPAAAGRRNKNDVKPSKTVADNDASATNGKKGKGKGKRSTTEKDKAATGEVKLDNQPPKKMDNDVNDDNDDLNKNPVVDEYEFDTSDEEDIRNTVGNIPMEWYRDYAHIGYDVEGRKIIKPKQGDELDEFLEKMDNPNYWRTVKDKMTGQNVVLTDQDIDTIERVKRGKYPDPTFNPYEPWIDFFTHETMIHPVTNQAAHKRSFIPSHLERLQVGKYVHAIKMGWMKPRPPPSKSDENDEENRQYYMLWSNDDQSDASKRMMMHIPAPKMKLPGHAESYNPPPEYLFTEEEELAWKNQEPEDRRMNFIPRKYSSLRLVPSYKQFITERFERCLDLYLCPRQRRTRMHVNPDDLIPKLPKPRDLQPFPTAQALVYRGHTGLVRSISVDPSGQWLASGSDDKTVKFWEVATGRCMRTIKTENVVKNIAWNPNPSVCLVAFVVDDNVVIANPRLADKLVVSSTDNMINSFNRDEDGESSLKVPVEWNMCSQTERDDGMYLRIKHPKALSQVTWHAKGDYFSVVMPQGEKMSVIIHQLSKRRSQNPFKKLKGLVQKVLFHPTKPFFFVATQRFVRVYNLVKQELMKKLLTNCKWVSSLAVHPGGDNVIIGSYDCRLSWFDLDLSTKPYQTLRHHKKAIRQVTYHSRYPLFASASDDGTVIVCHGMVYNDLLQNPLIVPVKILRGHEPTKDLGVLDCQFHPTQPWLFSSGSDSTIRLFT